VAEIRSGRVAAAPPAEWQRSMTAVVTRRTWAPSVLYGSIFYVVWLYGIAGAWGIHLTNLEEGTGSGNG
jgi:hypothetical protein